MQLFPLSPGITQAVTHLCWEGWQFCHDALQRLCKLCCETKLLSVIFPKNGIKQKQMLRSLTKTNYIEFLSSDDPNQGLQHEFHPGLLVLKFSSATAAAP